MERKGLAGTQDWVYSQGELDASRSCIICSLRQALKRFTHLVNGDWVCWECAQSAKGVSSGN